PSRRTEDAVNSSWKTFLGTAGVYFAARGALRLWQESRYSLLDRVVLITGGSRGLGLILAREYARRGARVALMARDAAELDRARDSLEVPGTEILALPCDVGDEQEVAKSIGLVLERWGRLDVVVNDAGQIEVGPLESLTPADFEDAMDTNFWGAFNVIHASLPHLRPGHGRIVNISSIGGLVGVPHLLAYTASKFALTGFSLGLRTELAQRGIAVTTICPGLMRTGSAVHAQFKGDSAREYAWFSTADALPLLSMSAERAARAIVRASQRGDVLLVLGLPAKLAAFAHALLPGAVVRAASVVNRFLPEGPGHSASSGAELEPAAAAH
ncbi:MAG TPA: SDR family NAD(P)-dependent oxidoreductase, partial [Polyangiaceae bacterium]|nr:SDR family NAD(P)-dependent oxidoreductase [Polyangiaceae bacterium]